MILFSNPGGRMGNQLFHYAFLESIRRPREWIFTLHMGNLKSQFLLNSGYFSIDVRWIVRTIEKLVDPLIFLLFVRTGIFSSWIEDQKGLHHRDGLVKHLVYVKGYFQNEACWGSGRQKARPQFRLATKERASQFLTSVPEGKIAVFLHVRRGDYLSWSVLGHKNPTLPMAYYKESVRIVREKCPQAFFVILGDDPSFERTNFAWLGPHEVSNQTPEVDLAIMALCRYGILSNSTLAWWGGFMMTERELALAPEMWLGYKAGIEHPPGIIPPWAEAVSRDLWYGPP